MKQVNISELKAHLSAYLNQVRAGETVIVCDRKRPVARLEPIEPADVQNDSDFVVIPAKRKPSEVHLPRRIPLKGGIDPVAVLIELRQDRF